MCLLLPKCQSINQGEQLFLLFTNVILPYFGRMLEHLDVSLRPLRPVSKMEVRSPPRMNVEHVGKCVCPQLRRVRWIPYFTQFLLISYGHCRSSPSLLQDSPSIPKMTDTTSARVSSLRVWLGRFPKTNLFPNPNNLIQFQKILSSGFEAISCPGRIQSPIHIPIERQP